MSGGPVFVAGPERSGTSLAFALLGSHPRLAMSRRTNLWRYFFGQYGDLRVDENLDLCLQTMERYKRLVKLQLDYSALRAEFVAGERTYPRLFQLIGEQHARKLGKPRWGDKSLHTERHADEIFAAYQGARIIHMVRDPRDRYASVETRWGVRRGGVGAGTAEWVGSVKLAERNRRRHGDGYMILRYETLVTAPESTLRTVCEFIGEDYAPEMLDMGGAAGFREQGSNSSYGRREAGAITADSVGRFHQILSPAQTDFIQRAARQPMERMGYQPVEVPRTVLASLTHHPLEWVRFGAWNLRQHRSERTGSGGVPSYRLVDVESAS